MAIYKVPSNLKISILNFVKYILPKNIVKDIDSLLSPCCKPLLSVEENYACNGSDTEFTSVTVNAGVQFANKTVVLLFTFSDSAREGQTTATETVTFDSNGSWTGDVETLTYFENDSTYITVGIIESGSKVVITSDPVLAENIQNCD